MIILGLGGKSPGMRKNAGCQLLPVATDISDFISSKKPAYVVCENRSQTYCSFLRPLTELIGSSGVQNL